MPTYELEKFAITTSADAYTVDLTNTHVDLPASGEGVVSSYSNSGTTITVFKGSEELNGVTTGTPVAGEFKVTASGTRITPNASPTSSGNPVIYGVASSMSDGNDTASIDFSIDIESALTITKTQTFGKSAGVAGTDAKGIQLILGSNEISFNNSTGTAVLDPSGTGQDIAVSANLQNISGTPTYTILTAAGSAQTDVIFVGDDHVITTATPTIDASSWDSVSLGESVQIKVELATGGVTYTDLGSVTAVFSGESAKGIQLILGANEIVFDNSTGTPSLSPSGATQDIAVSSNLQNITGTPTYSILTSAGSAQTDLLFDGDGGDGVITAATATIDASTWSSISLGESVQIKASLAYGGTTYTDTKSVTAMFTGETGDAGLRTIQGYLYYEKQTTPGTAPTAPSFTTYTFSSGDINGGSGATEVLGLSDTSAVDKWTNQPRTHTATSSNTHWTIRYFGTEASAGASTITVAYSTVVKETSFTGVVTFSGGTFSEDGSAVYETTTINGGHITTGTVAAARLSTDLLRVTGDAMTGGTVGGVTINPSKIFIGTGTFGNANTPFYVDSGGDFSLKDKLTWDQSAGTLSINGSITMTNIGSIDVGDFNNDAGFTDNTQANTATTNAATAQTAIDAMETQVVLDSSGMGLWNAAANVQLAEYGTTTTFWDGVGHATANKKLELNASGLTTWGDNATTYTTVTSAGLTIVDDSVTTGTFTSGTVTLYGGGATDKMVLNNTGMSIYSNNVLRASALDAGFTAYGDDTSTYSQMTSAGMTIFNDGSVADPNTGVAHFGTTMRVGEHSGSKTALRVNSTGALSIGTSSSSNFTVDEDGDVTVAGTFTLGAGTELNDGEVGGWEISSTKIYSTNIEINSTNRYILISDD